jgi:hypothetical protein
MTTTLSIRDEAPSGEKSGPLVVEFLTETITVRELIRGRVYQEVQDHNMAAAASASAAPAPLVRSTEEEELLNGPAAARAEQRARRRQVDWKKQHEVACEAFDRGGFLVLVDDEQKTSLDDEFTIRPGTEVTFLKLMPLVGG